MDLKDIRMSLDKKVVLSNIISVFEPDENIVALTLFGSHARGEADEYSDIDLGVILAEKTSGKFLLNFKRYAYNLGDLVFYSDFGFKFTRFLIFKNGTEVEITFGFERDFSNIHGNPYIVLFDKIKILGFHEFVTEKNEALDLNNDQENVIKSFWHDISHFITAVGRNQPIWAYGQLDELRKTVIGLYRISIRNFGEYYEKVDSILSEEMKKEISLTTTTNEFKSMLDAVVKLISIYKNLVREIAKSEKIIYSPELELIMMPKLEKLIEREKNKL